jgi:hypothetical protein
MNAARVRRATAEDAYVLGVIGPAAYAEAYACLWDRADAYSEQLQSFGSRAFEALFARSDTGSEQQRNKNSDSRRMSSSDPGAVIGDVGLYVSTPMFAEGR